MSTGFGHRWPALPRLVAVTLLAATSLAPEPAPAFKLGPHTQILQQSIGATIDMTTFSDVLGSLLTGSGNLGSDQHQLDMYRHFDSAPSPQAVCDRANSAWSAFYAAIRDDIQPQNAPEYDQIAGVSAARGAFGALTHALQDFYAHSNWVDLYVAAGQQPPQATALFPTCSAASLPANLQTGYFDLAYGVTGCPYSAISNAWIPPTGFAYCHETLNKDSNQTLHGQDLVPGTTTTYHALAAQLAAAHTTALYNTVVSQLTADWKIKFPQVRPDCLIQRVLVVDTTQSCRYFQLKFINDSQNGGTRLADGTVTVVNAAGIVIVSKSVSKGSWPFPEIDVPQCLSALTVQWQFYVDDNHITPTARQVTGSRQLSGASCDADVHIKPEDTLTYLVRYTDADTKISRYTDLTVTVNNGQSLVDAGSVDAGTTVWIDLGTCSAVFNLDFIYGYIDPTDNSTPKTATPDPPPYTASPGCLDEFTIDFGGQAYP